MNESISFPWARSCIAADGRSTERLRQAFASAADIIDEVVEVAGVEKRPIDPRLSALRRAAESLDPASTPRRQLDVIERFFHHATEALQRVESS